MDYLILFLEFFFLAIIGKKLGFDSGPFVNFGLIIFGQIYLLYLFHAEALNSETFYKYTLSLLFCLMTFWAVVRSFYRGRVFSQNDFLVTKKQDYLILHVLFLIYLVIQLYQVFLTVQDGGGGVRVIIYKSTLPLVVIHDVLQGAAYFFLAINLIRKKYFYISIIIISLVFSGSKQAPLIFLLELSFLSFLISGVRKISFLKTLAIGCLGFFLSAILFYSGDQSLRSIESFVMYRGDVYRYLFELNYRDNLYGAYDWITYFFHHTVRMIGYKVYDGPIGTMLFSLNYGTPLSETNGGPIIPFYVLFDVLFNDPKLYLYLTCSLFLGYMAGKLFLLGVRLFTNKYNLFSLIIGYWLMQSFYLVIDPTVFSYKFTPVFWIILPPFFIWKILRRKLNKPNNLRVDLNKELI
jgi:hypothetical protein